MSKKSKCLPNLSALLQRLNSEGGLERKDVETLKRLRRILEHELAVGDQKSIRKAVDDLAKCFLTTLE